VIEGPLETSAIMDSQIMRFPQDQRGEELRLAQVQLTALREFWFIQKQKLKPIAEGVKALLLPYQLEENPLKRALSAQAKNQELLFVLDDDWPPAEQPSPRMADRGKRQISYYMGNTGAELFDLYNDLVNVKYDGKWEEAEAEIKPIKDLIKLMEVSNC